MKKIYFILLFINLCFGQSKKDTLTIYFDSNEYKINSESEVILQTFFLKKTIEITNVAVEGFCDDVGKTNANASLADNRAKIIADYLKNNYSIIATSVIGKGELQTLNSSNPELLRKGNRKAVIVIEYSIKKVKADQDKSVSQYKNWNDSLKTGDKIIIQNLLFIGSTTRFEEPERAESELQKIVEYLKSNPKIEIEIQGHVCCISKSFKDARDVYSGKNNLSETRAKKVYDYFVSHEIVPERMSFKGYGRQFPIPNGEEMQNKRVEIVIMKM